MYDEVLKSDPSPMPLGPAILSLIHKRRRCVFVAYTSNARGRAAVIASAIRHRDSMKRGHLRDLPAGGVGDFALLATSLGIEAAKADAAVKRLQAKFERDGYKLFGSARSAQPKVWFKGRRMDITEAIKLSGTKSAYQTVYRRLARGWSTNEALDLA